MGAYFSLRDASEWEETVNQTLEPSIWSNVNYSPLSRSQHMLMQRSPGCVEFSYPSGMRQGGDLIQVSESADISLLIGFEEQAGRLYSALLFTSPENDLHKYCRATGQITLSSPKHSQQDSGILAGSTSLRGGASTTGGSGLAMDKFGQPEDCGPTQDAEFRYMLLYVVKEGILAYFSMEKDACMEVLRAIAMSYGKDPSVSHGQTFGPGTEAGASLAASMRVKCVEHHVGRTMAPVNRMLAEMLNADLGRRFAISCAAEEQSECTNCVVFCLRIMQGFKLSVRGIDIRRVCEERADLGPIAGKAVDAVWELLLRRARA